MQTSEVFYTDIGLEKAKNAQVSGIKISIVRMKISDHLIDSSETEEIHNWTSLIGNIVFDTEDYKLENPNLLRAHKQISSDGVSTVVITLSLGYSIGDFTCGSLGCYLEDGTLFCVIQLPQIRYKRKKSEISTGDSLEISLSLAITDGDVLDVTYLKSDVATIPSVSSWEDLPNIDEAPYSTYIVNNCTGNGIPALASIQETSSGRKWSFTLLSQNDWATSFNRVTINEIPNTTIVGYNSTEGVWEKANGEASLNMINPYVGFSSTNLSTETYNYNTQIYNKPKIVNSKNEEIILQGLVNTDQFNLVDKNQISQDSTVANSNTIWSSAVVQSIKDSLSQEIIQNGTKGLNAVAPLVFDKNNNLLRILIDKEIKDYSTYPVENQAIATELKYYTKTERLATVALTGDYNDLISKPEDNTNVTRYVQSLPDNPINCLYELAEDLFTFIGAYSLLDDSIAQGYQVTKEGLLLNDEVICTWNDLPTNWTSGENYSDLFELTGTRTGDVVIYEKDSVEHFVYQQIDDPTLFNISLYYVQSKDKISDYNQIALQSEVVALRNRVQTLENNYADLLSRIQALETSSGS